MSAEKLISRIKRDAEEKTREIIREAERAAEEIIGNAKKQAEREAEKIIANGKKQVENLKKIRLSKAHQEAQRAIMRVREEIIEECFNIAFEKLKTLSSEEYKNILDKIISETKKNMPSELEAYISREEDKEILGKHGIPVKGYINAIGGVVLQSLDGNMRVDNTFEGILERKKPVIRTIIGKILFQGS